jgi:hypothetical protein
MYKSWARIGDWRETLLERRSIESSRMNGRLWKTGLARASVVAARERPARLLNKTSPGTADL